MSGIITMSFTTATDIGSNRTPTTTFFIIVRIAPTATNTLLPTIITIITILRPFGNERYFCRSDVCQSESGRRYQRTLGRVQFPPAFLVVSIISAVSAYFSGRCPTTPATKSPAARRSRFPAARARKRRRPRPPAKAPRMRAISGWAEGFRAERGKRCSLRSSKIRFPDRPGSGRRPVPCH